MEFDFRSSVSRFVLVFTVLALCAGTLWAQGGTGELTGLVTDPTGAVIANAQVTLSNTATGEKRTAMTTGGGVYRFASLPVVGTYTLELAPKGFKGIKVQNIVISVGSTVSHDVKLELGASTEQVTVEAGAETVQTTESSLSQLVDRNIWQKMPLQVRNQNSFIELIAGAVPQDGSNNNRGAEVNGTRGGAGSYLVDGVDNNEQGQAGRGQISFYDKGGAATSISPDAIQEYRVITSSYSAEYGKGGGFITDLVLKSGTNQWHGSAFEYNRIQALTANDWFSSNAGIKDRLVRNQFGGSVGGPIFKDKTFFYGSAEFHRVRQAAPTPSVTATTPEFLNFVQSGGLQQWAESDPTGLCNNQAWWDGVVGPGNAVAAPCPGQLNLSGTLGTVFSSLRSNPAMNYPLATGATDNIGRGLWTTGLVYPVPLYGSIILTDPTSQNEARWSAKLDHRFSEKDSVSAVFLFQDSTYTDKYIGGNNFIGPAYIQDGRGQTLGLTWNHTLSPTVLNTFKASYLRHRLDFPAPKGTENSPAYYTIDGMGVDLGLSTGSPQFFTDNQFQYLDTVSVARGKHNMKFGAEYRRTRNGSSFFNDAKSTVLPWGIEDTLTDLGFSDQAEELIFGTGTHYYGGAYYMSAAVDSTSGSTGRPPEFYRGYRANEFSAFAQDDIRLTSRITVNLGLRWEYFGPPHNFKKGLDSNFYFGLPVTPFGTSTNPFVPFGNPFYASVATGRIAQRDREIWNKDTNNFSPRVGFAWDVFGTQKVVVRAGFGLMYDRIFNNVYENIRFNPPFFSDNQIGPFKNGVPVGPLSSPGLLADPFTNAARAQFNDPLFAPKPNPRHMDQNIVTPYYEQFHFGLQWEFAKGWVFEPEYVSTLGRKLLGLSDINTYNGRVSCLSSSTNAAQIALCTAAGFPAGFSSARPNSTIGADNFRSNGYASNYHSLQASVRKTYSAGLSLTANYTYSKALDDVSDLFNNGSTAAGQGRPTDNMNHSYDYGPADFDTRHRIVSTLSYDLPFLKQNRWLGGWGVNSIISYQTGHPWTPFSNASSYDLNKDGVRSDRVVPVGSVKSTYLHGKPPNGTVDPSKWVRASCSTSANDALWCNAPIGRNSVFGPSGANVDFNVSKKFKVTERMAFTFQANFFDLFNHPNFLNPTAGASGSTNRVNADFGSSRTTWGDNGGHRVTQLALRFDF